MEYYRTEFSLVAEYYDRDEADSYITWGKGNLIAIGEFDEAAVIGKCKFAIIESERWLEATDQPMDILLDVHSSLDPYNELFSSAIGLFDERVTDIIGDTMNLNLLVIDRVEISQEYRKEGHGLDLVEKIIRLFHSDADLVAIKAYPLQGECDPGERVSKDWKDKMLLDSFPKNMDRATKKLKEHYTQIGFESLGSDGLMIRTAHLSDSSI